MKEKVIELLKSQIWEEKDMTPKNFELANHYNMLIHDLISRVILLEEDKKDL